MTITHSLIRRLALWSLAAALLLCGTLPGGHARAEQAEPSSLESIKTTLDQIEEAVDREDATQEALVELRQKLNAAADELRGMVDELAARAREAEERLKQLGPAPAKDAPPESKEIADQREELTSSFNELDGDLKQARVLTVRADQLSERISQRRHALYASELFARTSSFFDPFFWANAARALPTELRSAQALMESWWYDSGGSARTAGAAFISLCIIALAIGLTRWWFPRLQPGAYGTRAAKAWMALWVFLWLAARTPAAAFAILLVWNTFGLLTFRVEQIVEGLLAGIAVAAFGHGVARGLFAPERPERRLVQEDDATARCFHNHLVWAARLLGALIVLQVVHKTLFALLIVTIATNALFAAATTALLLHLGWAARLLGALIVLQVVHKTLFAPLIVTIATNALFAAATTALLLHLVMRLGRIKRARGEALIAAAWAHPLGLLMAAVIALALALGYAGVAAFVALRVIVAAVVFGALYLLLAVTQTLFASIGEDTANGQRLAASLGISARSLGFGGALLSAFIRVMLILASFLLIMGPWEVSTADLFDTVRNIPFGFKIGEIHVSFQAVLGAVFVLVLLLVITRIVQRWLERELLPRTRIEPSLQFSIVTIFGYAGAITAIALALAGLGFDLQKVALIAGALSVGIGFGLQSIVSNFVSGLILLTERPIRVGDSITVKGEEGWVRRVRVRATEIETFDRASVIIPNSELITGVVKNWTRANTLGRIVIKITVAYQNDPAQVRDVLTGLARTHPQVVQTPPPAAFFVGFGEKGLEFELRAVVLDIEKGLSVRSDINHAIFQKFREVGISLAAV